MESVKGGEWGRDSARLEHRMPHMHTKQQQQRLLPCGKPNCTVYDAVGQRAGLINIKISCWSVSKWVAKVSNEGEPGPGLNRGQWLDDASVCGGSKATATVVGPQLIN